jgi:hypothetical protein
MHNGAAPDGVVPPDVPGYETVGQALAALEQARLRGTPVALLRVELEDRMPSGEDYVALGRRLRAVVRARDSVCWLGAAGYAILLLGAEPTGATSVATRLIRTLKAPCVVQAMPPGERPSDTLRRLIAPSMVAHHTPIGTAD